MSLAIACSTFLPEGRPSESYESNDNARDLNSHHGATGDGVLKSDHFQWIDFVTSLACINRKAGLAGHVLQYVVLTPWKSPLSAIMQWHRRRSS